MRMAIGAGAMLSMAMLACSAVNSSDGTNSSEDVGVATEELTLFNVTNDPVNGAGAIQCTIGGITMHCCPNWQDGNVHYVMTGVNLATNTFRCGRLIADPINTQRVTLAPATQTFLLDGVNFQSCPKGQAMVGLHWDAKRVACTPVSNEGHPLIAYTSSFRMTDGMRHCGPPSGIETTSGSFMWGVAPSRPDTLLCMH